ncbi:MAG: LysM peptidoglycan-binding domain-containing protein [Kiritimatiellia bacterium]|nr:LysM peptidoglycan-binding domain-containing protein [Kiritimatiellia bacterium]
MKSRIMVAVIVLLHGVAIGTLMTMQGCETMGRRRTTRQPPVLPPSQAPEVVHTPGTGLPTPAPIVPVISERPSADEPFIVEVQKGETLSQIAVRYGLTTRELADLNAIADPNRVRAGQKLTLPGYAAPADRPRNTVPEKPATVEKPKASANDSTYVVKAGDSLWNIARDHGVKVADLQRANKLEGDRIRSGQKLIIPGVASLQTPTAAPKAPVVQKPAPIPAPTPILTQPAPVIVTPPTPTPVAPVVVTPPAASAPVPMPPVQIPTKPPTLRTPVVPVPAPVPEPPDGAMTFPYPVQPGDTLDSIAKTFGTDPDVIVRLNPNLDLNQLTPGQRVILPAGP